MSTLDPKPSPALLYDAGVYLADLTEHLQKFDHVGAHRTHSWDLLNTPNIKTFVEYIEDDTRRELVESVIAAYEAMQGWDADVPFSVLQADYNDANIILDDGLGEMDEEDRDRAIQKKRQKWSVGGVIDFGDVVYSATVNDLAIGMAYHMLGHEDPIGAAASLYSGYCSKRQLLPAEQKALHTLVACRLAISVTNGAFSVAQEPENEYLLFHAQPAWEALELWWQDTPKEEVEVTLAGALIKNAYGPPKK